MHYIQTNTMIIRY